MDLIERWYGQKVYDTTTNGVMQETCRDFVHVQLGIASTFNAAETALIQKQDLYTSSIQSRLATSMEFQAKFLLGASVAKNLCGGKLKYTDATHHLPTFEIAYTGLHKTESLKSAMPQTEILLAQLRKQFSKKPAVDIHMMIFEVMTHGSVISTNGHRVEDAPKN